MYQNCTRHRYILHDSLTSLGWYHASPLTAPAPQIPLKSMSGMFTSTCTWQWVVFCGQGSSSCRTLVTCTYIFADIKVQNSMDHDCLKSAQSCTYVQSELQVSKVVFSQWAHLLSDSPSWMSTCHEPNLSPSQLFLISHIRLVKVQESFSAHDR